MRCYPLWLFAVLFLAGCSFSETDIPLPNKGGHVESQMHTVVVAAHPVAPVPATAPPDTIDLTTVLHTATAIPQRIESLERAVIVCGVILAIVGVANAALLVRLLAAPARAPSPAVVPVARAVPAVLAVPPVPDASASCACGAPISARSKTGRCRACAREYRLTMRAAETSARQAATAETATA